MSILILAQIVLFTGIRVDGASIESESEKNSEPGLEGAVAPTLL